MLVPQTIFPVTDLNAVSEEDPLIFAVLRIIQC